ncbi:hypothetical protein HanIR_Chr04g0198621 [Helianthus annuus]|nr:hypothetical protein HanIR_Chr04g0198621 [Helianthus annuus]
MRRRAFELVGRVAYGVSELVHTMRRRAFELVGRVAYDVSELGTPCAAARLSLSDGWRAACRSRGLPCTVVFTKTLFLR